LQLIISIRLKELYKDGFIYLVTADQIIVQSVKETQHEKQVPTFATRKKTHAQILPAHRTTEKNLTDVSLATALAYASLAVYAAAAHATIYPAPRPLFQVDRRGSCAH
jgi:hypothetical protein